MRGLIPSVPADTKQLKQQGRPSSSALTFSYTVACPRIQIETHPSYRLSEAWRMFLNQWEKAVQGEARHGHLHELNAKLLQESLNFLIPKYPFLTIPNLPPRA